MADIIDFLAALAAKRAAGEAGNVTPIAGAEVLKGPGANPPISQDPWFDMLGGPNIHQQPQPGKPLYLWAMDKTGRKTRLAGPFRNDIEAQQAMKQYSSTPTSNISLKISPE